MTEELRSMIIEYLEEMVERGDHTALNLLRFMAEDEEDE